MNIETLHNELGVTGKVTLSKTAYPIEALLKVAYDFTGEFYIYIGENGENYEVNIAFVDNRNPSADDVVAMCGRFMNEVCDQTVRQIVLKETGAIREAIVSAAFVEASKGINNKPTLVPGVSDKYKDDPLNILVQKG
ncbi:His-Xaa-Ser system protein HxsD [Escherichia coli]|nr:His-Xaa-Ser system protein HxsD [Escherichia coli]MCZ9249771.1 His-Xaa-Ser system protein HxsD [Escherichia albertii]EGA1367688.1 His-Xaa-Ser system protein HxsD [Escherichia coli]EKS7091243.1 His-Xaa-Ser system protein HxsD [Escherichia coli]EME2521080.1 His-Xaa-Ser system protein HxsD [Escherichia coli]